MDRTKIALGSSFDFSFPLRCNWPRASIWTPGQNSPLMAQNLRPLAFRSSRKRTEESIPAVPKVKMLNFFKNLFGSGSTENHATGNGHGYPPPLTSATAHSQPVYVEEIPEASAPAPQPPPVPQHFSAPRPQPNGNVVQ